MTIVYILAAILIFGVLIAVHELGHFLGFSGNAQLSQYLFFFFPHFPFF